MNAGVISARYARALLRYAASTGRAEEVYDQVKQLLAHPGTPPVPLEDALQRFTALVVGRHRADLLREMLSCYLGMYRHENGIRLAHLVTAVSSPELESRLETLVRGDTGCRVEMDSRVDPGIVGGFIFTVDDMMLDASVQRQIELVRRQLIQKNKRIV